MADVRTVATPVTAVGPSSRVGAASERRRVARRPVSRGVVRWLVAAFDIVLLSGIGAALLDALPTPLGPDLPGAVPLLALATVVAVNLMHFLEVYRFRVLGRPSAAVRRSVVAWLVTIGITVGIHELSGTASTRTIAWLSLWLACGTVGLIIARLVVAHLIRRWRHADRLKQVVAIVGAGPLAQRLLRRWATCSNLGLKITGVYDDRLSRLSPRCMGHRVRGTLDDLVRDVRVRGIDRVIVALPLSADRRLSEVVSKLSQLPIDVGLCTDQFGFQLKACAVSHIGDLTFLDAVERPLRDWGAIAKQIEDRVLATLILILIAPVLAVIAFLVKLDSPGPVLFRQKRYGFNNEVIEVFKFRTMYHHAADPNAEKLASRNDPRVTRLGAFLRRTSADELPQFINVLRGEMSIVGPRPHALAAKAGGLLYQDAVLAYDARHRVKPGITGWAQINGWRGETETTEQIARRVEHDLYYIENWSLLLDFYIVLRTPFALLKTESAY